MGNGATGLDVEDVEDVALVLEETTMLSLVVSATKRGNTHSRRGLGIGQEQKVGALGLQLEEVTLRERHTPQLHYHALLDAEVLHHPLGHLDRALLTGELEHAAEGALPTECEISKIMVACARWARRDDGSCMWKMGAWSSNCVISSSADVGRITLPPYSSSGEAAKSGWHVYERQ